MHCFKREYCSTVSRTFVQDCRLQHLQQLSLDTELKNELAKQQQQQHWHVLWRVWDNTKLTISTKMKLYQARVLRSLLWVARPGPSTPAKNADATPSRVLS